ncbi:coiled-coil domain-containing protein 172-like [Brachyhypopomus gauderio]|uniref:coiled-coil domain-containing protein 172-like n=1 Tax=Brachyhypopomus gauderio TaxID=698409 RepID=UPI0040430ACA
MSLDSLFKQILLTEQHVSKTTRQMHDVKAAIVTAQEEIKGFNEKLELAHVKLDEQAQLLAEAGLELHLTKKQHNQLEKKREELQREGSDLTQELERLRRGEVQEKEKFMKEITTFNNEFNLLSNRDVVFQSQTRSEIRSLQQEAEALNEEIEVMKQKNPWHVSMKAEQGSLQSTLRGLQMEFTELERDLEKALALTESLKTENLMVSQKPLTDSTCLRLKKQLEVYKEGELELLHEALSTEIQFLRSKLSQKNRSVC